MSFQCVSSLLFLSFFSANALSSTPFFYATNSTLFLSYYAYLPPVFFLFSSRSPLPSSAYTLSSHPVLFLLIFCLVCPYLLLCCFSTSFPLLFSHSSFASPPHLIFFLSLVPLISFQFLFLISFALLPSVKLLYLYLHSSPSISPFSLRKMDTRS